MKKLLNKKNNKGFSLVELIVVVLIMGIIAVALAPQVMKWVNTARTKTDENQVATIKSAAQTAVAEYMSEATLAAGSYKVDTSAVTITSEPNAAVSGKVDALATLLTKALGEFPAPQSGGNFYIHVTATGTVTVNKSSSAPTS